MSARFAALVLAALSALASAQNPYPDLLYYKFDEGPGGLTSNLAAPGVGANPATVSGHTLAPSGGQFAGALVGAGGTGTSNFVDSGWPTDLPGDFTLSFWLDLTAVTGTNVFMYACGDNSPNSFRSFTNGANGANNIVLKSAQMAGVIIPGGANPSAPHHVAWVYIASTREMRGYLDGVFVASVVQAVNTNSSTSNFRVGTWATQTALALNAKIDEFRLYSSALSDSDIAATWNVSLTNNPGPVVYCTAGTSTNGCVPAIGATGTPSASASSGFTLSVALLEGQKQGLFFYGLDNTGFTPSAWGAGTSFLCVKPPTQRTTNFSSGGTANACDGGIALDWNAYRAANPTALGSPFAAGQQVYAQLWYRDPPSPKTTNLSDAVSFVVGP